MHITYDAEADVFYIELRAVPARDTIDIEEGVSVLVDEDGHIVSLEALDAHARLGAAVHASAVAVEQLVPARTEKVAGRSQSAARDLVAAGE